ncbi:imidazole glycerol phosphate synthase subunit HisH [Hoeflea sp.]|uniref:imidazole glycerol phosphate synthase subunit HisH n=1 Tax=Hoeflea sp. TaxID=1940281 RepID=UPI003BB1DDA7
MSGSVVVVDYGIGNVFSVCNALKQVGAEPKLTRDIPTILAADRLILPGVGAFGRAMDAIRGFHLDETVSRYVETGRPFMGICIGMQVLMDSSSEFGAHEGLGLISGTVERIPGTTTTGEPLRVPHISWAQVGPAPSRSQADWTASPVSDPVGLLDFYFVHSYHCQPSDPDCLLAQADYGGNAITAAVKRDNILGVQFHPERSGPAGLAVLNRFISD